MATTRDELRTHLLATLQAAPEIPAEDRGHLADAFLDSLDKDFMLVPRGQAAQQRRMPSVQASVPPLPPRPRFPAGRAWWPWPGAVIGAIFLAWLLLGTVHHAPFIPIIILFFIAFRFLKPAMRRRHFS